MIRITIFTLIILLFGKKSQAQLSESTLPIFIIDTKGQNISDNPKVNVNLKVVYNGAGKINSLSSTTYHYNNFAGIEWRGSSSQSFPKKPYSIELRNDKGEDNPFALCDFPIESDYILFASYNEKSLMHNVFTMSLGRQMNMYSSRTKYVEVVLNGSYQGVYVLMEKIKVDKNRVNIADLTEVDNAGDQLTGGYIVKIDKGTGTSTGSFRSSYANKYGKYSEYFYHAPKVMTSTQRTYIKNYVSQFETAIYTVSPKDTVRGYRAFMDVKSFIKMFILNEISRNVDGYRISSYFHKDKNSKGGKLVAGPPWDYDISYGNADYCEGSRFDLWGYKFNDICNGDFWQVPGFWDKLIADPYFVNELRNYYFKERKTGGILDADKLKKEVDSYAIELKDAQVRNFSKWLIIGKYVWPSPNPIAQSYGGEVQELKTWIDNRLRWLDQNMPEEYIVTASEPSFEKMKVTVFPNPFIDRLQINIMNEAIEKATISVSNGLGRQVFIKSVDLKAGENLFEIPFDGNSPEILFVKVKKTNGEVVLQKAVKVN
jgi:CotH kinase protein